MKMIWLSQGQFTMVDDADYDFLNQWKWSAHKKGNMYYAVRRGPNGVGLTKMHRVILCLNDVEILGDHADRNSLNNQRYNLRPATKGQNNVNAIKRGNCASNFTGVFKRKNSLKWYSQIKKSGVKTYLGSYDTEQEAALAYNVAAIGAHGEFAYLNKL